MVSFIVPFYNLPAELVSECIDSILSLSLRKEEREIILIDDGSDDNTVIDILDDRKNDVTYIRQNNAGLSAARNTGLKIATGRYIQFVDSDDRLITEFYNLCLDIVRYKDPDMVMFDMTCTDKTHMKNNSAEPVDGAQYMRHNNLRATACGYIFSRNILGDLRFTPNMLHEDEEFTPQLVLRCEKVFNLDATAYYYRKRESSITNSPNKRSIIKRLDDVERIIIHLDQIADMMTAGDKQAMRRRVAQLTMDYIYNIVKLTRSGKQLESRIKRLGARGLFPLPDRNYTLKYTVFRHISKNAVVRKILKTAWG